MCQDTAVNQVATRAALASGVSPLVHVSTALSCTVGSGSEGVESLEIELTNTTTYTVTDRLQGWYAAGKMAAYSALSGCLWHHKTENDSRHNILTELAEHAPSGECKTFTHCAGVFVLSVVISAIEVCLLCYLPVPATYIGWSLGWLVGLPHHASSYEVRVQKGVIAEEIGAYRYGLAQDRGGKPAVT